MAETVSLTTPVSTTRSTIRITRLELITEPGAMRVTIEWASNLSSEAFSKTYDNTTTPTGAALITALNTANLTTNSLVKRVIQRLQTDGAIAAGTISGTPD